MMNDEEQDLGFGIWDLGGMMKSRGSGNSEFG